VWETRTWARLTRVKRPADMEVVLSSGQGVSGVWALGVGWSVRGSRGGASGLS